MAAASFIVGIDWGKTGSYTAYTGWVNGDGTGWDTSNGASADDGSFRSGSMTIMLRNKNGDFNRNYPGAVTFGQMNERVPIRIQAVHSAATTTIWAGYIESYNGPVYEPTGANDASWVTFTCSGVLASIAEDEVSSGAESSIDVDNALQIVADSVGLASGDVSFGDSGQEIALFFLKDQPARGAIAELLRSEMGGALFEQRDGVVKFVPRTGLLHGSPAATWGDDNGATPKVFPSRVRSIVRNEIATKVEVQTRKFFIGAGGTVIYDENLGQWQSPPQFRSVIIPANSSVGPRQLNPNRGGVVSFDGQTLTCTPYLDYTANSAADGTGSDQTGVVTITITNIGTLVDRYVYTITNTSGSTVYLTKLLIRAVPILDGSGSVPGVAELTTPTGANDPAIGAVSWTNPTNISSSNNSYATVTLTGGQTSRYLTVTGLGAGIESGATIMGVEAEVECKAGSVTTQALSARLVKGGVVDSALTRTVVMGTTEAYKPLGAGDDLWGSALTPATVNDSGFGIALFIATGLADTYSIDHVKVRIHFQTKVGIQDEVQTWTAELAVPGMKGGKKKQYTPFWVSDATKARDYAQQMLRIWRYPEELLELTFPWGDDPAIDAMIAAELYQLIAYQDTSLGPSRAAYVDELYRVMGLSHRVSVGSVPETTVLLKPSYNFRDLDHIVWDDFERADNPTSLGSTPTGKTWVDGGAGIGWKILDGKARPQSAALEQSFFDLEAANYVAEVTISNINSDASATAGFTVRRSNSSNYNRITFTRPNNVLNFQTVVSGVNTTIQSVAFTPPDVVELRVINQGNRIRAWANRKLLIDASSSANVNGTQHGFLSFQNNTYDFGDAYFQGL